MTAKRRVTWPDVLKAVRDEKARSGVVTALRSAGFTPDLACSQSRLVAACALTQLEDELEMARGSKADAARLAIREVRRRLEVEVEP